MESKGVHIGDRGQAFKTLIEGILKKGKLKPDYMKYLLSDKNMAVYSAAFTSKSVDDLNNYECYEMIGDVIVNKFIVMYMYKKFPFLCTHEGVKFVARLKINYGSKQTFSEIATKLGFWDFISATNDLREEQEQSLLEDVLEAFFGATEYVLDKKTMPGVGFACCYKILESMFDEINVSLEHTDLYDAKTQLKETFDMYGTKLGRIDYEETQTEDEPPMVLSNAVQIKARSYGMTKGEPDVNKPMGPEQRIVIGTGVARYKKDAQQMAAKEGLAYLKNKGFEKKPPKEYQKMAKLARGEEVPEEKVTQTEVLAICGEKKNINELFPTSGKSKYKRKYMSTALAHFCRQKNYAGIKVCLEMGADPNVLDSDGQSCLDLILIGKYNDKLVKAVLDKFLQKVDKLVVHENVLRVYYQPYLNSEKSEYFEAVREKFSVVKHGDEVDEKQDGLDEKQDRVDDDGIYIPRDDDWYYGKIPQNCSRDQLVNIMAKALLKFQEDQKKWTGKQDTLEEVAQMLDLWFEHDSNGKNKFAHLVPEDDIEQIDKFSADVVVKAGKY
jgi:dsRNA-specific ribonuclease